MKEMYEKIIIKHANRNIKTFKRNNTLQLRSYES